MSRIQEILKKAERDGGMQHTRGLGSPQPEWQQPAPSAAAAIAERPFAAATTGAPAAAPPIRPASPAAVASQLVEDRRLVAAHAPQSLAAEQYRSLRTRVKSAENGRALR